MPIQGIRYNIISGGEAHQSFQSTGSFIAYNPNDGIALVALDRTATQLDYDHRLPSQSGGKFPGPINSYLSIYYQDQSGGGTPGLVTVYATTEQMEVPYFWSIGRALTTFSTTLDIVQGSQPANPGTGVSRLWVDSGGHLHILQGTGSDYTVIDSNNVSTYVVLTVGDIIGPLNNTQIQMRNNSPALARDTSNTLHSLFQLDSNNYLNIWNAGGTYIRLLNQAGTIDIAHWDNAGNYVTPGFISTTSYVRTTSNVYLGSNGAALYGRNVANTADYAMVQVTGDNQTAILCGPGGIITFVNSGNSVRIGSIDNSGNLTMNGNIATSGGNISASVGWLYMGGSNGGVMAQNGPLYLRAAAGQQVVFDSGANVAHNIPTLAGSYITMTNTSPIYFEGSQQVYIQFRGDYGALYAPYGSGFISSYFKGISGLVACNGTPTAALESGYVISAYASALGTAWAIRSDRKLKTALEIVTDLECINRISNPSVNVYRFKYTDNEVDRLRMGLMADEVHPVAPEFAWTDAETGEPNSVEYGNMTAMLWGAIRNLSQRIVALEKPVAI